ncbi:cytochrome P450 81Q32-like [Euphorbia lathyris]|uniref:cytochrome P450 81Q32-like n=1 Tax=Euphorbia lathyris TaxID=212925 RepID=UPI0033140199
MVVRDCYGNVMLSSGGPLGSSISALHAELLIIYNSLYVVRDCGFQNIVVASDSISAINLLKGDQGLTNWLTVIRDDILDLLHSFRSIEFVFERRQANIVAHDLAAWIRSLSVMEILIEDFSNYTSKNVAENLLFIIFLTFLISFLALKHYKSVIHRKNHPPAPSPPALPIIGHLHLLKLPLLHHTLHNLSQKYGPIISLRFGSRPILVVSSPSAVEECFTKNDIVFANRPRFILHKYVAYNYTTLVQAPYGDHWRNLRRVSTLQILVEIFSPHRLNVFGSIRKDEVKRLVKNMFSSSIEAFGKVEIKSKFQNLTYNIMVRMISGKSYNGDEKEAEHFRELLKEAVAYGGTSNPRDMLGFLNWIDGGRYEKKVINLAKRFDDVYQRFIDEVRNKDGNTMIHHLLSLQQDEPEYYTDQIIKGLIQIMLFAGTDTSAITLEWALSNLLNNPTILQKVREEIDNKIGQQTLLEEHDLPKLPYLQNIISETLRLHPTAPLLVPHMSSDDCTVGGYHVPCGTILLVNAWAIQRDPKLWDDATSFKPERFDGDGHNKVVMMPFGLGRRACPGSGLAQRVVGLTLGTLIQCFEWEKVCGKEVDMGEGTGSFTTRKAQSLEAMCKARPIMHKILSPHHVHYDKD